MATYQTPSLSLEETPIPTRTLVYFRRRLRHELHELALRVFSHQSKTMGLTRKSMADRLEKDPAQISRWLGAPGNWTLDTFSDLLVGMAIDPRRMVSSLADELEATGERPHEVEGKSAAQPITYRVTAIPRVAIATDDNSQLRPSPQIKPPEFTPRTRKLAA